MDKLSPGCQVIFGFHAVSVRLKSALATVEQVYADTGRRDQRMRDFLARAALLSVPVKESNDESLQRLCGSPRHQGVVASVRPLPWGHSLDDLLDTVIPSEILLLILDGVTDPHNLGACLRVADGVGAHAVIAPKDHAAGLNATVSKVASGAAESVPYFRVTNLARTLRELQERDIQIIGTTGDAPKTLYDLKLSGPLAWVVGAEGAGMRQLTRKGCDQLVRLPMCGAVDSLNVSVASAVCLYETLRQRQAAPSLSQN